MVEAYIGAIFVDSSFNYEVVEDFFKRFLQHYFEDMTIYDTFANKHPTVCLLFMSIPQGLISRLTTSRHTCTTA